MFPVAFDYLRFSGMRQEYGDSKRRQKSLSDAWSERTGIPIDLSLKDEGVSGFRGKHHSDPDKYDLARFLDLVKCGRVQPGDYLLLENLDRLSREEEVPATHLLTSILMEGVIVVQLAPYELELTKKSDVFTIFRAVLELSRGHGESARKSQLISAAYEGNRQAAIAGRSDWFGRVPAWVAKTWPSEGRCELRLITERAEAVRLIYHLAAAGWGATRIVHRLSAQAVPPFGHRQPHLDEDGQQRRDRRGRLRWLKAGDTLGAGRWTRAYVQAMLRDRRAMGELKTKGGVVLRIPAAVTEAEWLAAQAGKIERSAYRGRPPARGPENLWQGMLTDAVTGYRYMATTRHGGGARPCRREVLVTHGGSSGETEGHSFPTAVFKKSVLRWLDEIDPADITAQDAPDNVAVIAGRLEQVRKQLADLKAEMEATGKTPKGALQLMSKWEDEELRLEEERRQAEQAAAHPLSEAWGQAKSLLNVLRTPEDHLRLRSLLRRIVEDIHVLVVPRGWDRLAAVQMRFKGSDQVRRYLIVIRKGRASRFRGERGQDTATTGSLREPVGLDLREPAHVAALREYLQSLDLAKLGEELEDLAVLDGPTE
jgi:DNA invertase Pin-like site-specific DNA recombinase